MHSLGHELEWLLEDWRRKSSVVPTIVHGGGVHRTDRGMRKAKEMITMASDICNACHMAVYSFMNSKTRLPSTNKLSAAPAGEKLPQGLARANIAVGRHVYEALAADNGV